MQTPLLTHAGPTTGPSNSATRYGPFAAGSSVVTWGSSEGTARTPIARGGTISKLRVRFPAALSAGQSFTITLRKNGVDTALTCTVTDAGLTASDLSNSVSVSAGDDLCWVVTPSGTPAAQTVVQIACVFEGTTSGQSVLFSGHSASTSSSYLPINASGLLAEDLARSICAAGGSVNRLYVRLSVAPGAGTSRTYTLRKNGVDTGLTVTISDAATTGNSSAATVTYAAGDTMSIACTVTGAAVSAAALLGMDWTPDTDGESLLFCTWAAALSASADRYGNANGHSSGAEATESNTYNLIPIACTIRKLRAETGTAPGAGKSRTFTLRAGGASQTLSAAITESNTTANDSSNSYSASAGDLIDILSSPSGTPAGSSYNRVGMVAYIAPAAGGASSGGLLLLGAG